MLCLQFDTLFIKRCKKNIEKKRIKIFITRDVIIVNTHTTYKIRLLFKVRERKRHVYGLVMVNYINSSMNCEKDVSLA